MVEGRLKRFKREVKFWKVGAQHIKSQFSPQKKIVKRKAPLMKAPGTIIININGQRRNNNQRRRKMIKMIKKPRSDILFESLF